MMFKFIFKSTIISYFFLYITVNSYANTIDQALNQTLNNNSDLKLEQSRLEQVKASKGGDAISEFLPNIYATIQRGRQKNDAADLDRSTLDKMNDQNVHEITLNQPIFNGLSSYNTNYQK